MVLTMSLADLLTVPRHPRSMTKAWILVVEDDKASAEALRELLDDSGYASSWAASPGEAIDAIGRDNRIAIAVLDLRLPELDGVRLLGRLREAVGERGSSLQAILCSGNAEARDLDFAMRSGFSAFVPKPIDRADFLNAIEDAARRYRQLEQDRQSRDGLLDRFRKLEDSFGSMARDVASLVAIPIPNAEDTNSTPEESAPSLERAWQGLHCKRLLEEARQLDAVLVRHKLDAAEWRLLLSVFEAELGDESISATSAAIAAGASASSGLRRVASLAERGFIVRSGDEGDGRRALLRLTEAGRATCRQMLDNIAGTNAPARSASVRR